MQRKGAPQQRLANEQQGEKARRIHVEVQQQRQLFQRRMRQQVGFIADENRVLLFALVQTHDGIGDLPHQIAAEVGRGEIQRQGNLAQRILETVNAQRKVFESLGCIVEEAEPDWTGAHEGYDILRAWGYAVGQGQHVRLHRELVKDTVIWEVERGQKLSASDIARAHALRADAWDKMRVFQEKYEYLITPTTQVLPFDVNQAYPTQIEGVKMSTYIE